MRLSKTQVDRSGQARAAKDGQYSSGAAEGVEVETVSPTRTKAQPGNRSAVAWLAMNRRIRNRMYGGVGGRRE